MTSTSQENRGFSMMPPAGIIVLAVLVWVSVAGTGSYLCFHFLSSPSKYPASIGATTVAGFLVWVLLTLQPSWELHFGVEWFTVVLGVMGLGVMVVGGLTGLVPAFFVGGACLVMAGIAWRWRSPRDLSGRRFKQFRQSRWPIRLKRLGVVAVVAVVVNLAEHNHHKWIEIPAFVAIFYFVVTGMGWVRRAKDHNRSLE